jgi:hypothetical protein
MAGKTRSRDLGPYTAPKAYGLFLLTMGMVAVRLEVLVAVANTSAAFPTLGFMKVPLWCAISSDARQTNDNSRSLADSEYIWVGNDAGMGLVDLGIHVLSSIL